MLIFSPDIAENDANFLEVECGNDDIKGDERLLGYCIGVTLPGEFSLSVLFYFGSLHWQFIEVVVSAHVCGVLHEEDEEVSFDVDEQLGRELEPDGLQLAYIIDPQDVTLVFFLLDVFGLLGVTNATHSVIIITTLLPTN